MRRAVQELTKSRCEPARSWRAYGHPAKMVVMMAMLELAVLASSVTCMAVRKFTGLGSCSPRRRCVEGVHGELVEVCNGNSGRAHDLTLDWC